MSTSDQPPAPKEGLGRRIARKFGLVSGPPKPSRRERRRQRQRERERESERESGSKSDREGRDDAGRDDAGSGSESGPDRGKEPSEEPGRGRGRRGRRGRDKEPSEGTSQDAPAEPEPEQTGPQRPEGMNDQFVPAGDGWWEAGNPDAITFGKQRRLYGTWHEAWDYVQPPRMPEGIWGIRGRDTDGDGEPVNDGWHVYVLNDTNPRKG